MVQARELHYIQHRHRFQKIHGFFFHVLLDSFIDFFDFLLSAVRISCFERKFMVETVLTTTGVMECMLMRIWASMYILVASFTLWQLLDQIVSRRPELNRKWPFSNGVRVRMISSNFSRRAHSSTALAPKRWPRPPITINAHCLVAETGKFLRTVETVTENVTCCIPKLLQHFSYIKFLF